MSKLEESVGFYRKMSDLQEKLRRSEEERLQLEEKFALLMRACRDEEEVRLNNLRERYEAFLEEEKHRKERNDRIMQTLDRIESRAAILTAKSERLRLLRKHYEAYMLRMYPGWKYVNNTSHSKLDSESERNLPYAGLASTPSADIVPHYQHNYPISHPVNQVLTSANHPYSAVNQHLPSSQQYSTVNQPLSSVQTFPLANKPLPASQAFTSVPQPLASGQSYSFVTQPLHCGHSYSFVTQPLPSATQHLPSVQSHPSINQPLSSHNVYPSVNQPLPSSSHPYPTVNQPSSSIQPYPTSVSQPYLILETPSIGRQTYPSVHPYPSSVAAPTTQKPPPLSGGADDQPHLVDGISPQMAVSSQPLSEVRKALETAPAISAVDSTTVKNMTETQEDSNIGRKQQEENLVVNQDNASQEITQPNKIDQIDGYVNRAAEMLKINGINENDDIIMFQNLNEVMPQENKNLGNSVDIELEQNTSGDILNVTLSDDGILQDEPSKTVQNTDENKYIQITDNTDLQQCGQGDVAIASVTLDKQQKNTNNATFLGAGDSFVPESDLAKENITSIQEQSESSLKNKELEVEAVTNTQETDKTQYAEGDEQQYAEQQQWDENAAQYYQQDGQYYQYGDEVYQQEYAEGEYDQQYAGEYDQQYADQYAEYNQQYTEEEYQQLLQQQQEQQQQQNGGEAEKLAVIEGNENGQVQTYNQDVEQYNQQTQEYNQQLQEYDQQTQQYEQQKEDEQQGKVLEQRENEPTEQNEQQKEQQHNQQEREHLSQQKQDDQQNQQQIENDQHIHHEDKRSEIDEQKQISDVVREEKVAVSHTNKIEENDKIQGQEGNDSESSRDDVKLDAVPQQPELSSDVTDPTLSSEKVEQYRQLLGVSTAGEPETSETDELEAQLAALVDTKKAGSEQKETEQRTSAPEKKTTAAVVKPTGEDTTSSEGKPAGVKSVVTQKTSRPVSKKLPDLNKVLESDSESLQLDATVSNAESDDFDFSSEK